MSLSVEFVHEQADGVVEILFKCNSSPVWFHYDTRDGDVLVTRMGVTYSDDYEILVKGMLLALYNQKYDDYRLTRPA